MKCHFLPLACVCAVGMSLISCENKASVADYRRAIVESNEARLAALDTRFELYESLLKERESSAEKVAKMRANLVDLGIRRSRRRMEKSSIEREVYRLRSEFEQYKQDAVTAARNGAVGEKIDVLEVPGRRTYHDVVISRVSDVGLEIKHRNGRARIPFLSPTFADELLNYHYGIAYGNSPRNKSAERKLIAHIKAWARKTHQTQTTN